MKASRLPKKSMGLRSCCAIILAGSCALATAQKKSGQNPESIQSQQPAPSSPVGTTPDESAARLTSSIVRLTRDWFENRLSTSGAGAEMREIERESYDGFPLVHYHVYVKGAPKNQLYQSLQWPIGENAISVTLEGLSLAADGLVICAGRVPGQCRGEKLDDDVDFVFRATKGEPFRLKLVSEDTKTNIYFGVVPSPIMNKNKGCTLEVIKLSPHFEVAMLRAFGFQPNEELQFASKSYEESQEKSVKADADGKYVMALLPFVKNKPSGKTDVTLKGLNCAPHLSFEWGK